MTIVSNATDAATIRRMVAEGWTPDAAAEHVRRNAPVERSEPSGRAEGSAREERPVAPSPTLTSQINASRSVVVTIPTAPAKELMPNQQSKQAHWSPRSRARKAFRNEAAWQAAMMLPADWEPMAGSVALGIHVHWPKRRRPDLDAVVASCKAAIDGIADAGVIADDKQIKKLTATQEYGAKGDGVTRLTIEEMPE